MKTMLIFLLVTVSCTVSGIQSAHAWGLPKVGAEGSIEEMRQMQWVKDHAPGREYARLSITVQGQCIHDCYKSDRGADTRAMADDWKKQTSEEERSKYVGH